MSTSGADRTCCPKCGQSFQPFALSIHILLSHQSLADAQCALPEYGAVAVDKGIRCCLCERLFRAGELRRHLLRAHHVEIPREWNQTLGSPGMQRLQMLPPAAIDAFRDSLHPEWMGIGEDASRNIGYLAREDGRFGSHAAYDGYDDESSA
jgi:hypothetical protein